nr:unnamed protein product [Callosobruchus analis]
MEGNREETEGSAQPSSGKEG